MRCPLLPLCIFLDLDNTIVGDGSALLSAMHSNVNMNFPHLIDTTSVFGTNFVRPGLEKFISTAKARFPCVEVFVFSAGTRDWVTSVVAGVEKAHGVRFNRPLFCRDNMVMSGGVLRKSLAAIMPAVTFALKDKYPAVKQKTALHRIMADRVIMIDDLPNIVLEGAKQVVSPQYNMPALIGMSKVIYKRLFEGKPDPFWETLVRYMPGSEGTFSNEFIRRLSITIRRAKGLRS
jgi:hypothetical protein